MKLHCLIFAKYNKFYILDVGVNYIQLIKVSYYNTSKTNFI